MNIGQIINRITTIIQDVSFSSEDDILPLVNDFVSEISGLFRLPALQEQSTITIASDATVNMVSMPETYDRDLYRVFNAGSSRQVNIRSQVKALEDLYGGDETGYAEDVAIDDGYLWFRPMPDTALGDQVLTLFYYRKPVPIEDLDDLTVEFDGIPSQLAKHAVDYALKELFSIVEDGIDGHPNTEMYAAKYASCIPKFELYCRNSPKFTPVIKRSARFF